ncbi:MAG: preprotein translocase subunit SecY [Bacilli bacterium]|nr:preprotein translocase subunit SecY [Bacilli bacterium]
MKKIASILKNKEIMTRIMFTIMIFLVIRIGAAITVPGVTVGEELGNAMNSASAVALMDMLGGGALESFSIFALGVSPYITAQIIIQLLSKDVLPALTELSKQGQYGRKKTEMATRYLTLMLGAVQAYGIIKTMENGEYVTVNNPGFWTYAYIVTIMLAGAMTVMWLGDQITDKGLGNGISMVIFAGIVRGLPNKIKTAFTTWVGTGEVYKEPPLVIKGWILFLLYILAFILILAFVVFIELAKRKIPVQHTGKSGGQTAAMSRASFLPIKVNSAGVIPVIFASSIMMTPTVIASFISSDTPKWLGIFSYTEMYDMGSWKMPWGLLIYITLIMLFAFFYATLQIDPEQLAENFRKNGSYIPGVRPGNETERYVKKVVNRVTCIGALALTFIAALPVVLSLSGLFGNNSSLAIGGTGLIIAVGVSLELNDQVNGLLAGKTFDEVQASAGRD